MSACLVTIMSNKGMSSKCIRPPPCKVLTLVAATLEPKSLGLAICVSKSWRDSLCIDEFWEPLCYSYFPSFATIHLADPSLSFLKLYKLLYIYVTRSLHRIKIFPRPVFNPEDLIFVIAAQVRNPDTTKEGFVTAFTTVARRLEPSIDGMFRFDLEIKDGAWLPHGSLNKARITWNVTIEGYKAVFTMLHFKETDQGPRLVDGWVSKELPASRYELDWHTSGLVGELKLGMKEENGVVKVVKVEVGMLNVLTWRCVGFKDAFGYLKHFLSIYS